ncbi:MAG: threonine--tRNA ligase [Candidatus Hydrogenedentes bacterium]|jgi:threonyl-tRNA synthetase|nr:threonine--tRNA ligase [Candidatus Hydrogenedentota bacterium]
MSQSAAVLSDTKMSQIYRLRHSLSHILAAAVRQIRPEAKLAFGPPVENGFYYDFDFGDKPIGEADLNDIEQRMAAIIKARIPFERHEKSFDDALRFLEESGEVYKVEYARELIETGAAQGNAISFYSSGDFIDMCEGPHLEHTGQVPKKSFKLDRISGSYWRGDEKRPMLTRIYGLAFESGKELSDYLAMRKIAMERDHRKLGEELDLFIQDSEVGVGLPLWTPKGTVIRDELEKWARETEFLAGYQRVSTPSVTRKELYIRSGHVPYYEDSMYPAMPVDENDHYYLRPMCCPHHHKIYASRLRSYRELPLRLCEYGDVFRYEKHGSLSGLLRVRAMCMNDAHIYCTPDQVESEFNAVISMYQMYYGHLRMGNFRVRLSLHDKNSDKFVDRYEDWERSEAIVRRVLDNLGITYEEEAGEAAFYGPKVDIQVKNLMGREETVSTCQLDFVMPERFDLNYVDADGKQKRPYILHRAPLSTHERMISFLIEFYGGAFPTWMAPVQVRLIPVNDELMDYAHSIESKLRASFFRTEVDYSAESFNKKIRNAVTQKIPNLWILGKKEMEEGVVTWRRHAVKEQQCLPLDKALSLLENVRDKRVMDNFPDVELG